MQKYDFQNNLAFTVNKTALDTELREKVVVTVGQWKVMVMLVNQDGLTQKEIAKRLGLEGPTLIPIIDKMEKDDLVDPLDRRNNRIYRADKADRLWNEMVNCALKIRQISLKNIPNDDIDIAKDVLENIYQNLRKWLDVGYNIGNHDALVDLTAGTGHNTTISVSTTATQ